MISNAVGLKRGNALVAIALVMFIVDMSGTTEVRPLHLQGLLPMTGGGWDVGGACLPATLMAMRDVNEMQGLLDGYKFTFSLYDTKVS